MRRANMEWVTDIFEESVSKDSLHAFCGIHEEHPSHHTSTSTSMELEDNASDIDNDEDVDRAIAISLSEEIQRKEIEKEAQLKEDELLARAIQQSLNLEGSSDGETEHDSPEFEDCHSDHDGDGIEDSIPPVEIEEIIDSVPAEEIQEIKVSVPAEDWRKKKVMAEEIQETKVSVPAEDWQKKKVLAEEIELIRSSVPAEDWRKKKVLAEEIKAKGSVPAKEIEKIKAPVRPEEIEINLRRNYQNVVPPVEIEINPRRNHQNVVPPKEIEINSRRNHRNVDLPKEIEINPRRNHQNVDPPKEIEINPRRNHRNVDPPKEIEINPRRNHHNVDPPKEIEINPRRNHRNVDPPKEIEINPRRNHQNVDPPKEIEINPRRNHQNVDPPEEIEINLRRKHQNVDPPEEIEINLRRNHQNIDQRSYYSNDMECDVCYYYIPKNPHGHLEYRSHPYWLQMYCTSHEHDGTPRCCSCERLKSYDSIFIGLDDGRKLCLECHDSAIMDTDGCQPLYVEIKKFYEGLGMKLEQQVPILLVERQALNEAREGEKDGHHNMPETRGICLSEEQSSRQVPRRPKTKGGQSSNDSVETEPQKLRRHCEVTAVLILHGLPRLLTGTILTHELMHAWLRLQGYPALLPEVEEGICQVMALMWLEIELRRESVDFTPERKFGEFLKQSIVSDASPAYGDGFRVGWQAARRFGLQRTLDHIRKTGTFPR